LLQHDNVRKESLVFDAEMAAKIANVNVDLNSSARITTNDEDDEK